MLSDLQLPNNLIQPFESVPHLSAQYAAFLLPQRVAWIGEVSVLKFKSELFCLSVLQSLITRVVSPLLKLQKLNLIANCPAWIHVDNIWLRDSNVFYIMCQRRDAASIDTSRVYESMDLDKIEAGTLRKLAKVLVLLFKPDRLVTTFMSMLLDSMARGEITAAEIADTLNDQKKRKLFMADKKYGRTDNDRGDVLFWNKKKTPVASPLKKPRRDYRVIPNEASRPQRMSHIGEAFHTSEIGNEPKGF